jgi:hypothetical protein
MSEQTVSFLVDSGLLNAFVHAAEKNSRDNAELLKAFMAEYVQHDLRRQQYEEWFRGKVEKGQAEIKAGLGFSSGQAELQMEAFKASLARMSEDPTS